jgi:hypothetical protein
VFDGDSSIGYFLVMGCGICDQKKLTFKGHFLAGGPEGFGCLVWWEICNRSEGQGKLMKGRKKRGRGI